MTLMTRLKSAAAAIGQRTLGTTLGVGLAVAVMAPPAQAFSQPVALPHSDDVAPALWRISDADSTIYLFGTIHVLRPTTQWRSERVEKAFDSADQVWFEVVNPDDQAAAMPLIQQHGLSLDRPLSSRLNGEDWARLEAAAAAAGMPSAQLEPMRPWLAALSLGVVPLVKAGYDAKSGVELILRARAQASGKPILGLETLEKQLLMLAEMPEETQIEFLSWSLDEIDNAAVNLDFVVDAWSKGDVDAIGASLESFREVSEDTYQVMQTRRNADWANQIKTLLDGSGAAFIAVGAAHLAGPESVQAMLAQKGVTVERIQ